MKKLYILLAVLMLTGCVYPFSVELDNAVDSAIVIDANILIGNTSTVQLSYLQPLDVGQRGGSYVRPTGTVYLEDEQGNTYTAVNSGSGFIIHSSDIHSSGKYRVTVVSSGKTYRSEWIEPVAPPRITDVSFSADDTNVYVEMSMETDGTGSGYAASSVDEIWKFHADYIRFYGYDPETNEVKALMSPDLSHYWCWQKNSSALQTIIDYSGLSGRVDHYVVNTFPRNDGRNHSEYHVRVKVWNLTPEQYQYRKLLEENASIGADLFSPEPGEIRGNVYCETDPSEKVYGYVNISSVATWDAILDSQFDKWKAPNSLLELEPDQFPPMYSAGYMPVDDIIGGAGSFVVGWGRSRCYDCVMAGGTLNKPDFD